MDSQSVGVRGGGERGRRKGEREEEEENESEKGQLRDKDPPSRSPPLLPSPSFRSGRTHKR